MDEVPAFLASEYEPASPERAAFWIIPCPLEKSVSYGWGTADGPNAILNASLQLEAIENGLAPGRGGFHTTRPVNCDGSMEAVLCRIEAAVERALEHGAIPVLLGGEHTVTLGALRAMAIHARTKGQKLGVVQFDAHADLRDSYEGSRLSHATVMRRVVEELELPLAQFAVREISPEEIEVREKLGLTHYDAFFLARVGLPEKPLPEDFPENIYISFDVDGLDSSLMPATGTPSPGGLNWRETHFILEKCAEGHKIVGLDVVELAPIAGLHHADYTAARLAHLLMALAQNSQQPDHTKKTDQKQ